MEHEVDGIKLELTTNAIEDEFPAVLFQISSKHFEMELLLSDPCVVSKNEWIAFRDFVNEGGKSLVGTNCLDFCPYNGEVSMSCDSKWIRFEVAKSGAGGDGESLMKLSRGEFGETFTKMLDMIIADGMMNTSWEEIKKREEKIKKMAEKYESD